MSRWIIVKYAEPDEEYDYEWRVSKFSHTFKECGINQDMWVNKIDAEKALSIVQKYNPGVSYRVVKVKED